MGIDSLCSAVANVMKREKGHDSIWRGKVTDQGVLVAGRSYTYTVAVDIPIKNGDWVYVMLSDSKAVVIGR